jgi:hypothetical protein
MKTESITDKINKFQAETPSLNTNKGQLFKKFAALYETKMITFF